MKTSSSTESEPIPLHLGAGIEAITAAEQEMGIKFPDLLKMIWQVSNGLELPGGWQIYPVFDPANPRKTCNSIVYENTPGKGRWEYMSGDLIAIAGNGTGNHLVLRIESGTLLPDILVWDHERNKTKAWGKTLDDILKKAQARVIAIQKARAKSLRGK